MTGALRVLQYRLSRIQLTIYGHFIDSDAFPVHRNCDVPRLPFDFDLAGWEDNPIRPGGVRKQVLVFGVEAGEHGNSVADQAVSGLARVALFDGLAQALANPGRGVLLILAGWRLLALDTANQVD